MVKFFIFSGLLIFTICGCAETPKPVTYNYSTQQKMQAAYHWDLLADNVAGEVIKQIKNSNRLIYVEAGCGAPDSPCGIHQESPFLQGFRDLLMARLIESGVAVIDHLEGNPMIISNKVQVVYHQDNRRTRLVRPGVLTGLAALGEGMGAIINDAVEYGSKTRQYIVGTVGLLGAVGLYEIFDNSRTDLPHREVIITTSIKKDNRYLMKQCSIYYINDKDYWHYETPPPTAVISVTN